MPRWRRYRGLMILLILVAMLWLLHVPLLSGLGGWLVRDDAPHASDAAVVLSTGIDYYPRLMEAARLHRAGLADRIVVNGNRKSPALRHLESLGYRRAQPWYSETLRILKVLGVPADKVVAIDAQDVYDTDSEAQRVGSELLRQGIESITVTTSKYHTRRAGHIWQRRFGDRLTIRTASAKNDPFDATSWWRNGRQIRSLLAEYGAWLFLYWKDWRGID
jgi:uncharacterized SAM-binding protein YcdF (DUF218 family)